MSDVKDKFDFKSLLNKLEALDKCDDPECPACHPETAPKPEPKSDLGKKLADIQNLSKAEVGKAMLQAAANVKGLAILLTIKQSIPGQEVFSSEKKEEAFDSTLASLALAAAIVESTAAGLDKMPDETYEKVRDKFYGKTENAEVKQ